MNIRKNIWLVPVILVISIIPTLRKRQLSTDDLLEDEQFNQNVQWWER